MTKTSKLTAGRLREVLRYDPETGVFVWVVDHRNIWAGDRAGSNSRTDGYRYVKIDGVQYKANRLAVLYMTGAWPSDHVDHVNGDTSDDKWSNLRAATRSQNHGNRKRSRNNTSGAKGVFAKPNGTYRAYITKDKVRHHLGIFYSFDAAKAAYAKAAVALHGEFARAE